MNFEEKFKKGYELLNDQDLDNSLEIARELQKMNPASAEGYMLEGEIMIKLNQWDRGIDHFSTAIEKDPENGRLYNLRGFCCLNKEKLEDARENFEQAIKLDDLPSGHRNLVLYMLLTESGKEAIQYLLGRIKADPADVENWILMGDLMKKGGHDEKARSYYEQALKMTPENEYVQKQLEN